MIQTYYSIPGLPPYCTLSEFKMVGGRSWFLHAVGALLAFIIDVELSGITTHGWEQSTLEQLLNDYYHAITND